MSKNFRDFITLTGRHMKLYFRDKQSFMTSLITPVILIVLFVTFLKNVYESSLISIIPKGMELSETLVNTFTASWLISSILGVTCVTLAFCANTIMVNDKVNCCLQDIIIAPVNRVVISLSYFFANFLSTILVCSICMIIGGIYINSNGWYMSTWDVLMTIATMILTTAFGTLLASIVLSFINSQGGASAIATLVSSMYGFVCGAYMPISQFGEGIRNFVAMVPGTHGTVLFRYYMMHGIIDEIGKDIPEEVTDAIRTGFDNKLTLFDNTLSNNQMFGILGFSVLALLIIFSALVFIKKK